MTSCDTNILAYGLNPGAPEHTLASAFLIKHAEDSSFALSEMVLVELYNLIRNATIMRVPLSPSQAVAKIKELRTNPRWTILKGMIDVSDQVWRVAATHEFPRRAVFDARLAYSLAAEGVTRFATRNVSDFERFGAFEVFDPLAS